MSVSAPNLPDYREQSPAVAARFAKLKERPVVLEIENLGRQFPGDKGPVTALRARTGASLLTPFLLFKKISLFLFSLFLFSHGLHLSLAFL